MLALATPTPLTCPQLTDWNMASMYGKLAIFIFAAWAGEGGMCV